jgi:acetyl esterase
MPLDPLVKTFLDRAASIPRPKAWDVPPAITRQSFAGMMELTAARDVAVGRIDNFIIPGPGGEIRARGYAPVAASGALPALIYFHGGGFVAGSLESHDGLCRQFAAEGGFKVIAVDYRLAPENPYPAAVDDAWAATRWIEQNAADLGVDAGRIAVGGDSAGAMLAAIVTQLAKEKGGLKLAFQLLMFPNTQIGGETSSLNEFAVGYFLERRAIEYFHSLYLPPGTDTASPRVSPRRASDVMLGGYDPLHDEGLAYANKLKAAGVKVAIVDHADMVHCFIYLQTILPQAHDAVADAAKAVRAALDAA